MSILYSMYLHIYQMKLYNATLQYLRYNICIKRAASKHQTKQKYNI